MSAPQATLPAGTAVPRAVFIGATRYRRHSYGANHPLRIPRVSLTYDLIHAYHALDATEFLQSRMASPAELTAYHTPDYIEALQQAEAAGKVTDAQRKRYNIGNFENPFFPGLFATPATAAGGSIQAAEQVVAGRIAFSPAGGMHHAAPSRARGFCFFNDAVLAVLRLRVAGWRVLYLDIDAHHGDGVEQAFQSDPDVLVFSLHMDTAYAYPFSGGRVEDVGPCGNALNVPLPKQTNDSEYRLVFESLWPQAMAAFRPDAVVLQAGTDILMADPLGKFDISTALFLDVVQRVLADAPTHVDGTPRLAVLGGGGYHPLLLARCWTGVWGLLSGRALALEMPAAGRALLEGVDWDGPDEDDVAVLLDSRLEPRREGVVRPEIPALVERLRRSHPLFSAAV